MNLSFDPQYYHCQKGRGRKEDSSRVTSQTVGAPDAVVVPLHRPDLLGTATKAHTDGKSVSQVRTEIGVFVHTVSLMRGPGLRPVEYIVVVERSSPGADPPGVEVTCHVCIQRILREDSLSERLTENLLRDQFTTGHTKTLGPTETLTTSTFVTRVVTKTTVVPRDKKFDTLES